jgi:hypothetical protein
VQEHRAERERRIDRVGVRRLVEDVFDGAFVLGEERVDLRLVQVGERRVDDVRLDPPVPELAPANYFLLRLINVSPLLPRTLVFSRRGSFSKRS